MKSLFNSQAKVFLLLSLALAVSAVLPATSLAAPVDLSKSPLTNSTTTLVRPNLMFILDDSGSMGWDYLPDWGSGYSGTDFLFKNSSFNGVAYNPSVFYEKPTYFNADGTLNTSTYPSQTGASTATGASSATKPNWIQVKRDGYGIQSTSTDNLEDSTNLSRYAYFYTTIPGEYCTALDFKNCVTATAPSGVNIYPAPLRWCRTSTLATQPATPTGGSPVVSCRSIQDTTYSNPRYPSPRKATITVNSSASSTSVTSIKVNSVEILSAATTASATYTTVANNIVDNINKCTTVVTGSCGTSGYAALITGSTGTSKTITIVAPTNTSTFTYLPAILQSGTMSITRTAFSGTNVPGRSLLSVITPANTSYAYPGSSAASLDRNDCTGTCTYAQEMENYANWWAYYHTRMQAMKSSVSRAFKSIDSRYRVGFTTINSTSTAAGDSLVPIATFELTQKNTWYNKLFITNPSSSTPLRTGLSRVGQIFAHKYGAAADPMQYSCQQNFAILSTDGYWNGSTGKALDGATDIGNLDAAATTLLPYREGNATSNTLADVAKYYYDTDLRTPTLGNCTGAIAGEPICSTFTAPLTDDPYNNVFVSSTDSNTKQHMVTFTMGLGIDGTLNYTSDYADATSGDYYNLKNGLGTPTVVWPDPIASTTGARIDDLWHAAVNGRGVYFSAKKPNDIIDGFSAALAAISGKTGAGAAAATSTLNPVAGDNYAYVASYTTNKWIGNLEGRLINTTNGVVSEAAAWCVEDVVAGACAAPGAIVLDTSGGSKVYNCVNGASVVEMPIACPGKMAAFVAPSTDTRKIWTKGPSSTTLNNFKISGGDLSATNFNSAKLINLTQWPTLTGAQKADAVGDTLVNYLRGQTDHEDIASNVVGTVDNRLFRPREATLGDAVESQPAYVAKPTFSYLDTGYSTFKSDYAGRAGTVYMGANDGMLHAFNAINDPLEGGKERWAYVPSMVIPNMWQLADSNYSTNHAFFANGSPVVSDVTIGGVWKTILVAGLNGGGRGYYALDITDPSAPKLLWEFTPTEDPDLGFTFGKPVITKKDDGTWVVLVTSGYNNIPDVVCNLLLGPGPDGNPQPKGCLKYPLISTGNGVGYLYVLNASTGAKISKIGTGVGTIATPSGLAQISAWADEPEKNNTATFTYGGDLLGNVWRFDINAGTVTKFAELKLGGTPQPITIKPELGNVLTSDGKIHRMVFVGTGKYLETSDLTNLDKQTFYGIKDDDEVGGTVTPTLINPRGSGATNGTAAGNDRMVAQTLATAGSSRTISSNAVDLITDRGWFVDFKDPGERQNVSSQLVQGTLLVPTTVPSNTVCAPGGTGWLNFFNYRNGGAVDTGTNKASTKANAPIVGVNVIYIPDPVTGKPKPVVSVVTADHPTPDIVPGVPFSGAGSGFQKKRVIWRELAN